VTPRLLKAVIVVMLAACNPSAQSSAQPARGSTQSFTITDVASFDSPWAMAFLPGSNDALVTEKPGRLWLVDLTTGRKRAVSGVPAVAAGGQGGLLYVARSPRFGEDGLIYLTYAEPSPNGGSGLALARARLVPDAAGARLEDLQVLWRDPEGGRGGQFGAIVTFAPDGRSLFLTTGERQRFTPAQDMSQPLGKILHLTLDGKPAPGNPWAGRAGARTVTVADPPKDTQAAKNAEGRQFTWPGPNPTPAETWTLGHRNAYGLAFDSAGRLWEAEMGPRGGDELNLILPGRNYGWPLVSNGGNYDGVPIPAHSTRPDLEAPKLWWNPSISPTSLLIYSGKLFPQWKGSGFIGTLTGPGLIRVALNGANARKAEQWDMGARIRFVGEGPDGAIYLLEDRAGARLRKLTPAAQTRR
jgi:glucose/arabinose dehydrogenase